MKKRKTRLYAGHHLNKVPVDSPMTFDRVGIKNKSCTLRLVLHPLALVPGKTQLGKGASSSLYYPGWLPQWVAGIGL